MTAGVVAMTTPPTAPGMDRIPYSMNMLNRNMPPTAMPARTSQSRRSRAGRTPPGSRSRRRRAANSGTSTATARAMRSPEARYTGNALVTILLMGVPLPKTAMPAASSA